MFVISKNWDIGSSIKIIIGIKYLIWYPSIILFPIGVNARYSASKPNVKMNKNNNVKKIFIFLSIINLFFSNIADNKIIVPIIKLIW